MRLSLRFIVPLGLALAAIAYATLADLEGEGAAAEKGA